MPNQPFFNAHHSPIGAYASFTLGYPGASGGFDLERAQPPREQVYVILENEDGRYYEGLPFFGDNFDESKWFTLNDSSHAEEQHNRTLRHFRQEEITRDFRLGTDTWQAGDLTLRVLSQVRCRIPKRRRRTC